MFLEYKPDFLQLDPPLPAAHSFVHHNLGPLAQSPLKFEREIVRNKLRQKCPNSIQKFSTDGCFYNKQVN
jgi:hypothetical protein